MNFFVVYSQFCLFYPIIFLSCYLLLYWYIIVSLFNHSSWQINQFCCSTQYVSCDICVVFIKSNLIISIPISFFIVNLLVYQILSSFKRTKALGKCLYSILMVYQVHEIYHGSTYPTYIKGISSLSFCMAAFKGLIKCCPHDLITKTYIFINYLEYIQHGQVT